jgi:hypothetical protein
MRVNPVFIDATRLNGARLKGSLVIIRDTYGMKCIWKLGRIDALDIIKDQSIERP